MRLSSWTSPRRDDKEQVVVDYLMKLRTAIIADTCSSWGWRVGTHRFPGAAENAGQLWITWSSRGQWVGGLPGSAEDGEWGVDTWSGWRRWIVVNYLEQLKTVDSCELPGAAEDGGWLWITWSSWRRWIPVAVNYLEQLMLWWHRPAELVHPIAKLLRFQKQNLNLERTALFLFSSNFFLKLSAKDPPPLFHTSRKIVNEVGVWNISNPSQPKHSILPLMEGYEFTCIMKKQTWACSPSWWRRDIHRTSLTRHH